MSEKPDMKEVREFYEKMQESLQKFIVGYEELINTLIVALLSDGTVIIEGVPGTAKTSACKLFAKKIGGSFGRIQGAVDIQPIDILGMRTFSKEGGFQFNKGPVFSNIFLVDEMNRLTPKAQGALLEAIAERQVTIDNERYSLSSPFMVIATQNPYEMEGTFMLIEAQKDRFTYSVQVTPLSAEDEMRILARDMNRELDLKDLLSKETAIATPENIVRMQESIREVYASEDILGYIADLVTATRKHSDVKQGVSTRGSLALLRGSQVCAAIQGRGYIIPDDVKQLVPYVFAHRIMLKRESQLTGVTVPNVISNILETVPVR